MACFFLHPPEDGAQGQATTVVEATPSPGDIAARLANGQLIKELTVGLGMPEDVGPGLNPLGNERARDH